MRTTKCPFVMPPADVPGFAMGITTNYGIMQVLPQGRGRRKIVKNDRRCVI
jgi:hypothetical protein